MADSSGTQHQEREQIPDPKDTLILAQMEQHMAQVRIQAARPKGAGGFPSRNEAGPHPSPSARLTR